MYKIFFSCGTSAFKRNSLEYIARASIEAIVPNKSAPNLAQWYEEPLATNTIFFIFSGTLILILPFLHIFCLNKLVRIALCSYISFSIPDFFSILLLLKNIIP